MSKLTVYNMQGERTGDVDFPDELLVREKGEQAVHDAIVALQANRRSGTAKTKKRGEVSGGGKKPFAQKGTGRARAGSIRSPIWRGGGTIFGPQPRSYYQRLPKKVARLAFARVLSDRIIGGQLGVVDHFDPAGAKTKSVAALLKKLGFNKGALLVIEQGNAAALRAARNLAGVTVAAPADVNTYDVVRHAQMLVSQAALAGLQERLRQRQGRTA